LLRAERCAGSSVAGAMTGLPSGPRRVIAPGAQETVDPEAYLAIHALYLKQVATVSELAALTSLKAGTLERHLALLEHSGDAIFRARHELWQLTPDGAVRHKHRLADEAAHNPAIELVRRAYDDFQRLNASLKDQCAKWQLRYEKPNDHDDLAYDTKVIDGLGAINEGAGNMLTTMSAALARLGDYRPRLHAAFDRLRQGDADAFMGASCGSYYDIWMELHQDLMATLGVDRHSEEPAYDRRT
jgi:hypothetical protein